MIERWPTIGLFGGSTTPVFQHALAVFGLSFDNIFALDREPSGAT